MAPTFGFIEHIVTREARTWSRNATLRFLARVSSATLIIFIKTQKWNQYQKKKDKLKNDKLKNGDDLKNGGKIKQKDNLKIKYNLKKGQPQKWGRLKNQDNY